VSRRIFAVIERGMTDKTAVCVFPWELQVLQLVHGGAVEEKSIDEMSAVKEGVVKIEKQKTKHSNVMPPDLRAQLEMMAYVDPEEDPARDPASEYQRMVDKYGMDKELPIPCVARVYGEFSSGAFERVLEKHAKDVAPRPTYLKAADEGLGKSPDQMSMKELRDALTERGVSWKATEGKAALAEKLEAALAPA
jgi:hypothetical protein